jgi:hypothetical protein
MRLRRASKVIKQLRSIGYIYVKNAISVSRYRIFKILKQHLRRECANELPHHPLCALWLSILWDIHKLSLHLL